MGKIKETILAKKDRPAVEPKPPSMRRIKRMNKSSIESARAGRNSTMTPSRKVSLRGLRRKEKDRNTPSGTFTQVIPEAVVFRFKKKHRPIETLVHEGGGVRKSKTTERRVPTLICATDDSGRIAQFELMAEQKLGKIENRKRKVITHMVDKQDGNFKFHKHDVKF